MANVNNREFGTWHLPGRSPLVAYSQPVMDQIAEDVMAAARRGTGEETGGMLFGSADDEEVKILAYRSLPRKRRAAAFQLSEDDETILRHMLQTSGNDPELRKLVCVGWYHSHIEEQVALSEDDVRVWDQYFAFRWQVALVMRPQADGVIRAGFFFRPEKGQTRTDASLKEFDVLPPAPKSRMAADPLDEPASAPQPPADLFEAPGERGSRRWMWYTLAAGGAAVAAVAAGWYTGQTGGRGPEPAVLQSSVGLRLTEKAGMITAHWDPSSPLLRAVSAPRLEITDGARQDSLNLTPATVNSGEWTTAHLTRDVRVRLVARGANEAPVVLEAARFIGTDAPVETRTALPAPGALALRTEVSGLESDLGRQMAENRRLETRLDLSKRLLETRLAVKAAAPEPPPTPNNTAPTVTPVAPPPAAVVAPKPEASEPAPPVVTQPPATPSPAATEPLRYTGPTSGRIIWTGYLAPNSSLTIEGRRASTGSVTGALPTAQARVAVYPAEISGGGLSVFTSNASRNNTTEGRGARNGWMNTTFVFDADRARDIQLGQAPGAGNPQFIQLRSGDRPVSAAVIEWQVAP